MKQAIELSDPVKLQMLAAQLELIKVRPYWTPSDCCLVFNISPDKLRCLDRDGLGPNWMRVGGTKHITQDAAVAWFERLGRGGA
jgi:hypothetical protein